MNAAFFDAVRTTVFAGSLTQDQVDGIDIICSAWAELGAAATIAIVVAAR